MDQQWRIRLPLESSSTFSSSSNSSSNGDPTNDMDRRRRVGGEEANENTSLLAARDAHEYGYTDEYDDHRNNNNDPEQAPRFCRGQPQHHFQYRSITIQHQRTIPLNDVLDAGGGDGEGGDGDGEQQWHDRQQQQEYFQGMSTPSTLSESGGVIDEEMIDDYEAYLNYYENQGPRGSDGAGVQLLLPGAQRRHRHFRLMAAATALLTFVFMTFLTLMGSLARKGYRRHSYRQSLPELPDPSTMLSSAGFVYAADFADEATTLAELAQMMLPSWYGLAVAQLQVFTPDVMPGDVFTSRKILLKTRDLVDALETVYPWYNNTSDKKGKKKRRGYNKHNGHDPVKRKKEKDLLSTLRQHLDRGYMRVGEFQDLHNAHVLYNYHQLDYYRGRVLRWKNEFTAFQKSHDVEAYLSKPSQGCFDRKRSHLFWGEIDTVPCGSDLATRTLALLGLKQLERASDYLNRSLVLESITNKEAHEVYHNLRKELRSIFDEFELFGFLMFSATDSPALTKEAILHVKSARQKLGDINDDYTAYSIYVADDEYPLERKRLEQRLGDAWADFKQWTFDIDFEATLAYLAEGMKRSSSQQGPIPLKTFLLQQSRHPTHHFVIGNKAGDADSIISAITLAYVESVKGKVQKTPIVSITQRYLMTQRPDVTLLLELAGITDPSSSLLFIDSPQIRKDAAGADVTLVDHNVLDHRFEKREGWQVREILDHHRDEGRYKKTCSGPARNIAFQDDEALVSSTTTLIAEKLDEVWEPPGMYPASTGLLLLGTILLDTVNLSPEVGKVTQRDVDALQVLVNRTRWFDLSEHSLSILQINDRTPQPDLTSVFNVLQNAKYDSDYWTSLTVIDALRYDYKDFSDNNGDRFGISTVLMPMQSFLAKKNIWSNISRYMDDVGVQFLFIMFAFQQDGVFHRQLSLCGKNMDEDVLSNIAAYLNRPGQSSLGLQDVSADLLHFHDKGSSRQQHGISIKTYSQTNIRPSRKQIGPMIEQYFSTAATTIAT